MSSASKYDQDYYENGKRSGKSCYENYRWLPDLTIDMSKSIASFLTIEEGQRVLDYGCAKGFMVKAFRMMGIDSYGVDISQYAIEKLDEDVLQYCRLIKRPSDAFDQSYDWLLTKDVLEHMEFADLKELLVSARNSVKRMFHVFPLGDDGAYRIAEYHEDVTHIHAENEQWWCNLFEDCGWKIVDKGYGIDGLKDNWKDVHSEGNYFVILEKPE